MLDLDRFKPVNDGMGHQAGDLLLRQVAEAIVAASRDSDRVFRYGGDEFAVLLPRTDGDHGRTVAERVRAAVKAVVGPGTTWRGRARSLEASAGTASFPSDGSHGRGGPPRGRPGPVRREALGRRPRRQRRRGPRHRRASSPSRRRRRSTRADGLT